MYIQKFIEGVFKARNFIVAAILAEAIVSTSFAETVSYSYDSLNRLTKILYGSGAAITYVYDSMGNRLVKSLYSSGIPANLPPNQASLLSPAINAVVGGTLTLQWNGSDPNPGDRLSYELYLGTATNTLRKIWSGGQTSFMPWNLSANSTYYWKIITKDSQNAETVGPIWNFATGTATTNPPPLALTVALTGTGGGTLTSVPSGIACTGAPTDACSSDFALGSTVKLIALSDGSSRLENWSLASCALTPNCFITMDTDKRVTAGFKLVPPVQTSYPAYPTILPTEYASFAQLAPILPYMYLPYQIKSHNRLFIENVILDGPAAQLIQVDWKGGYTGDYSVVTGTTRISGTVTIKNVSVSVENIVIQ